MKPTLLLALLAALLLLPARPAPAGDRTVTVEGAHYRLTSSGAKAEAEEWVRVLEAAWPLYEEFFGKAPKLAKGERLAVTFVETRDDMNAAIRAAGGTPPGIAGGYYDPGSKTAFAWRQPSVWMTRALLIHECCHQFHRLARISDGVSPPAWYVEGVADHIAHHTWDGQRLRLGVVPMVTLEDWPTAALATLKSGKPRFEDVIEGRAELDRPLCEHLVRYLVQGGEGKLRRRFDDIAADLDRGSKVGWTVFTRTFGAEQKLRDEVRAFTVSKQQPWESLFVEWDSRGEAALRGSSPSVMALCRRRAETRQVIANVRRPAGGAWKAGVLLRYAGPRDYVVGLIDNGRRVYIDRLRDGSWERLADVEAPPAAKDDVWHVEGRNGSESATFLVNGVTIGDVEGGAGSMGLALDSCTIDFTEIETR